MKMMFLKIKMVKNHFQSFLLVVRHEFYSVWCYKYSLDDLLSFLASSGASHRITAAMDDETSAIEGAMTTALRRVVVASYCMSCLPSGCHSIMKRNNYTMNHLQ